MAVTLDNTVGGANANSYVSQAEADAYFEGRVNSSVWSSATSGNKDIALVNATSRIDHEYFHGAPASTTQRLQYPRTSMEDENGRVVQTSIIPKRIKEATCELALALLGSTDIQALTQLGDFELLTVGGITIKPREGVVNRLPDEVVRLLAPFMRSGRNIALERG